MPTLSIFRKYTQRIAQEYRDYRNFLMHDTSIEADICRGILLALTVAIIGTIVLHCVPATPAEVTNGACVQ